MEFHISRQARQKYRFDESIFSSNGNVIFANFHAGRVFAQNINRVRDAAHHPELAVSAGQVNAMALIDEILHYVVSLYRNQRFSQVHGKALEQLEKKVGRRSMQKTLARFNQLFPPVLVYQGKQSEADYLKGTSDGLSHRGTTVEEILLLWLANQNPAFQPYLEFFDDDELTSSSEYQKVISGLKEFFSNSPTFGPDDQDLVEMLRAPAIAVPNSLEGQLEYIRDRWGYLLSHYLMKLLGSLDMISEEHKFGGLGPGIIQVPLYDRESDLERFSQDSEWMPRLVMMAKNIYVWMAQLSRQFNRPIKQLDQVPDEALDQLSRWGFTGLWLIGLWERSRASATIKQLCGNPEAIASAYSLADYRIADELGGEAALENLRQRAVQRGIRLASDMVPNHMGIDSNWVVEHPDWFLGLDYSPFPAYSFEGVDLSSDKRCRIQLEDHYYNHSDAAVVFRRHDSHDGSDRYIYHGNDGTSMPWNDTAQLNYLKPEVREAVIQTILHVARQFPIIRFDAAMTLTKRHYQRLWFPQPGTGASIPSRSEFGMTADQFNQAMPEEFWREVVERVAQEAPDTLLLAEAFWLMEGYFVRNLGMHRVYNSAFMNLLRDEENGKYRQVMKNTLEFDPQILKRFVNFMNNPDERTAVDQFGKGGKYFAICLMMVTMPGLPMFGHGQVEGFTEKYGMEFKRDYWNEQPDKGFVQHHEDIIFPLLRKRHLFADVENFRLYDFFLHGGHVNENVFAYSNRSGDERSLVVVHNRFADTHGWVRTSCTFLDKDAGSLKQQSLGEGLGLRSAQNLFVIFRDSLTGLEYIRESRTLLEKGMELDLGGYQAYVFMDFREVSDDREHSWRRIYDHLNGAGSYNLDKLRLEIPVMQVLRPWREIANPGYLGWLLQNRNVQCQSKVADQLTNEASHKYEQFLAGVQAHTGQNLPVKSLNAGMLERFCAVFQLPRVDARLTPSQRNAILAASDFVTRNFSDDRWMILFIWIFLADFSGRQTLLPGSDENVFFDQWRLAVVVDDCLRHMGQSEWNAARLVKIIRLIFRLQKMIANSQGQNLDVILENLIKDDLFSDLMGINKFEGITWINQEGFEELLWWLVVLDILPELSTREKITDLKVEQLVKKYKRLDQILLAEKRSEFKLDGLLKALKGIRWESQA